MTAARRVGSDGPVTAQLADGREFTGDEILVAAGRRPATASVGLDRVGSTGTRCPGGPAAAGHGRDPGGGSLLSATAAWDAALRVTAVSTRPARYPAPTHGNGIRGTSQLVIGDDRRTVVVATFIGPSLQELLHSATVAICGGDRRSPVARGPVLPDRQRNLAAPARGPRLVIAARGDRHGWLADRRLRPAV
jgi:hypothetical protein